MKKKDNIEQIFRKHLKDLEYTAPNESWEYIEKKISNKEDDKIIPIWFNARLILFAVASVLILGIFIINNDYKKEDFLESNIAKINKKTNPNIIKEISISKNIHREQWKSSEDSNYIQNDEKNVDSKFTAGNSLLNKMTLNHKKRDFNAKKNLAIKNFNTNIFDDSKTNFTQGIENKIFNEKQLSKEKNENSENLEIHYDKKSILAISSENICCTDSLFVSEMKKNEKKKNKQIKINKEPKFFIAAHVAPIIASGTSGSSLDSKFDNNPKKFKNNFSYGIRILYAINPKIKLRSGINVLNLDYNTENVFYEQTENNQQSISTINQMPNNYIFTNGSAPSNGWGIGITPQNQGSLLHEITFYETPLEISYKILDTRLKVDFITGFSSYFIQKNKLFLISDSEKIEIGTYQNLNNIHYSGNAGIGFEYEILKNVKLNFEPVFKYNFNTFRDKDNSFRPYFIGFYSGVILKF